MCQCEIIQNCNNTRRRQRVGYRNSLTEDPPLDHSLLDSEELGDLDRTFRGFGILEMAASVFLVGEGVA